MAAVVVLSNVLVQHPFQATLGRLNLADLLTWGAFSYPLAFLVTDTTNRLLGAADRAPRRLSRLRVRRRAVGSGSRRRASPLPRARRSWSASFSTSASSTACATAPGGRRRPSPASPARRPTRWSSSRSPSRRPSCCSARTTTSRSDARRSSGSSAFEAPRWVSWALGDFSVKLLMAAFALIPYRVIVGYLRAAPAGAT